MNITFKYYENEQEVIVKGSCRHLVTRVTVWNPNDDVYVDQQAIVCSGCGELLELDGDNIESDWEYED